MAVGVSTLGVGVGALVEVGDGVATCVDVGDGAAVDVGVRDGATVCVGVGDGVAVCVGVCVAVGDGAAETGVSVGVGVSVSESAGDSGASGDIGEGASGTAMAAAAAFGSESAVGVSGTDVAVKFATAVAAAARIIYGLAGGLADCWAQARTMSDTQRTRVSGRLRLVEIISSVHKKSGVWASVSFWRPNSFRVSKYMGIVERYSVKVHNAPATLWIPAFAGITGHKAGMTAQ